MYEQDKMIRNKWQRITDLVLHEVRAQEKEVRKVKADAMATQGKWTLWVDVTPRNQRWSEIQKIVSSLSLTPPASLSPWSPEVCFSWTPFLSHADNMFEPGNPQQRLEI